MTERRRVAVMLTALIFAAIWWKPGIGETGDDARMILEAQHLWKYWGFRVATDMSHIGMIALIAPLSSSVLAMHLMVSAIWVVGIDILYDYARQVTSEDAAFATALMTAMLPVMLVFQSQVMTEIPFCVLTIASFALLARDRWIWALVVAVIATTFRSIGMFLPMAILSCQGYRLLKSDTRKAFAFLVPGTIAVYLFMRFFGRTPTLDTLRSGTGYGPVIDWVDVPGRWATNIVGYLIDYLPYSFVSAETATALGIFFYILAFVGLVRLRNGPLLSYLVGYAGALMVWPEVMAGWRYLIPVMPFLILGLAHLLHAHATKKERYVVFGLYLASCLYFTGLTLKQGHVEDPRWTAYKNLAREFPWPEGAVIAARKSNTMELLSRRRSVGYKFTNPDALIADLDSRGVTHVVLDALEYRQTNDYLAPAIAQNLLRFELVMETKKPPMAVLRLR